MQAAITEKLLRSLLAKGAQREAIRDQVVIGLEARPRERWIAFNVVRRLPGVRRPARVSVGRYPEMGLAQLRERGRHLLRDMAAGVDPRRRKAEEDKQRFDVVAEQFIQRMGQARTHRSIELRVRRELISRWGGRSIYTLTRADIAALVVEIVNRGHREAARQTLIYAKRLFAWAVTCGLLEHSPAAAVRAKDIIGSKKPRQRLLTDAELRLIWRATAELNYPWRQYMQLLLLSGTRRSELGEAVWAEFDLGRALWTIPPERMKNEEAHVLPLSARAVAILRSLPRLGPYLFSYNGTAPFDTHTALKRELDARIAELNGGEAIPKWVFHDARRAFRTSLSTLGVTHIVAELMLAHRQSSLHRTYDLFRHLDERRAAYDLWTAHLLSIVEPPPELPANVVPLRA